LPLLAVLGEELLLASSSQRKGAQEEVVSVRELSDGAISRAVEKAVEKLKAELQQGVAALRSMEDVDAGRLNEKFAADGGHFTFRYAGMAEYYDGLEGMIGNPDPRVWEQMEWEHAHSNYGQACFSCWWCGETTARDEFDYVVHQAAKEEKTPNGLREQGHQNWTLQRFMHEHRALIEKAGLRKEEVVALRLYTGPMYVWYNNVLRFRTAPFDAARVPFDSYKRHVPSSPSGHNGHAKGKAAFPFRTTLHVLNSAIIKLSRTQPAVRVYRGTKGGVLPDQFWSPNAHNVRGGIELAFMSTTTDRSVALEYARADDKPSIVFEMQMGMVDRGAPLQWLSQFPTEAEILFAPLTGLEVVGIPKVGTRFPILAC
jgi:hypothetical protein